MPGEPSGKGYVFRVDGGGRGGYSSYGEGLNPMGAAYRESRFQEEVAKSEREQEREEMENERRQIELKAARRASEGDDATEMAFAKIGSLKPDSLHFEDEYEKMMGDKHIHGAMLGSLSKELESYMAQKLEKHQEYIKRWSDIADHYGWQGDIRTLPKNDDGSFNWDKIQPMFDKARQKREEVAAQQQEELGKYGMRAGTFTDPETGKTVTKIEKIDTSDFRGSNNAPAKSAPQFKEGQKIKQGDSVYVIKDGQPVPAE